MVKMIILFIVFQFPLPFLSTLHTVSGCLVCILLFGMQINIAHVTDLSDSGRKTKLSDCHQILITLSLKC